MRPLIFSLASSFLWVGCAPPPAPVASEPVRQSPAASVSPPAVTAVPPPVAAPPAPRPSTPVSAPVVSNRTIDGITFQGISFDTRSHRLTIVDQPGGPGSQFPDSRSAGRSRNAIAAINAGFFTPEGAPLGKVIASGKASGAWNNASSLGSGVFHESTSGNAAISRRGAVFSGGSHRELLQSGPILVENGRTISGLDSSKTAVRSVLLWDGGTRWWLGLGSACTLSHLGTALGSGSPSGWPVRHALNLDGGRSSDLWVSPNAVGGPLNIRPVWNRPVRNFLALVPR